MPKKRRGSEEATDRFRRLIKRGADMPLAAAADPAALRFAFSSGSAGPQGRLAAIMARHATEMKGKGRLHRFSLATA